MAEWEVQRLGEFVRGRQDAIIAAWTAEIRTLAPARALSQPALVDHLPKILGRIAALAESVPSNERASLTEAPRAHAIDRLAHGFDLDEVVKEYSTLRRCILDLWAREIGPDIKVAELRRLDAALDQSIAESSVRYAEARERMLRAINRISEAALGTTDLDAFLQELLQATLETTEAADTVVVLLREGDLLRVRAAVGLEEEPNRAFRLRIGDGFAGRVAALKKPVFLSHAATDPVVKRAVIREKGVRALYGVPLVHAGAVVGVAHMGSLTAFEFSEEDKLLFQTMASRATSVIVQAELTRERERALLEREQVEEVLRFLLVASKELSESLDYERTLTKIAGLAVPRIADWCSIELAEDGQIRSLAVAHVDPAKVDMAKDFRRRFPPRPDAPRGIANVLRTGRPELYEDISDDLLSSGSYNEDALEAIKELGIRSAMIVPLVARGRSLGAITFVSAESGRRFGARDMEMAHDLASRAALAVDNALLYRGAQEAIRLREEVLAIVSHDLRNPLSAIYMSAELLRMKAATDARLRKQIETIQRGASRMEHLIGDLLDMASIQAGRLSLNKRREAICPIVAEALDANEPMARSHGVALLRDLSRGEMHVMCDRERVLQVLSNLIGNAIKFCRSGESITVRVESQEKETIIAVIDTGPGIPEDQLPYIFEPYWTARRQGKTGTGLGLYITKGIVEAHGGRIWAESKVGAGCAFYFTLERAA